MSASDAPLPPPLPALSEEDVHAVVTPVDLTRDKDRWEHALGDQARLALLGRTVLEEQTTELLFLVRPLPQSADAFEVRQPPS
jgi:hypothetical protein